MTFNSAPLKKGVFGLFALTSLSLFSCKKENVPPSQLQITATEENSDATVFKLIENGANKVVLRPGPRDGQDVYVDKLSNFPSGNQNSVHELPINTWTNGGLPVNTRSFIRFEDLKLIPANATIISAKLFLFGMSSSLNSPQGNSYYPSSPYEQFGDNSCWIQQVVGANWDESTLTYDNQPASTTTDEAALSASTSQWNYNAVADVTKIVRKMVANPSNNFGFAIKLQTEAIYRSVVFASSETSIRSERPKLVVVYQ
jgi:hypothetical protein